MSLSPLIENNKSLKWHEKISLTISTQQSKWRRYKGGGSGGYTMALKDLTLIFQGILTINNFDLHLLNLPSTNPERQTVHHLKIDHLDIEKKFLEDYFDEFGFTRVYTIRHAGTDLYIAGFNFKVREGEEKLEGRYPVFGKHKLRYFFQKDFAEEIAASYPDYQLVVD